MGRILFLLIGTFWLFSPSCLAQENNFQYFSVGEGLSQSQVFDMIEDQKGYLWLGTNRGGLNRFDGENFEEFNVVNHGLINDVINAIYEVDTVLLIGASNGMSVFDGKVFTNYFVSKQEQISITDFIMYQGKILVGTEKGVYEFNGKRFKYFNQYNPSRRVSINCFFEDSRNRLWIGTGRGLILIDNGKRIMLRADEGLTNDMITGISEDKTGKIWLASYRGVYVYDGKGFSNFDTENGLASNFLNDVFCHENGSVWLASQNKGISVLNPSDSTINILNAESGLCNNNVQGILQDSWGNIWISTSGGGICKYFGQEFRHLNISDRPADNLVYSLCQDTSGIFWFAAADDGIVRWDSTGFTRFDQTNGFVNTKTKAMLRDNRGRMWFGTDDAGLAYFNGETFQFLKYRNRVLGRYTKDIAEDEFGNIWVASSSEGVYKISPRDSTIEVQEIVQDTLLFGDSLVYTTDTLYRYEPLMTYQVEKIGILNKRINALHFDRKGRLWLATRREGLACYDENGLRSYDRNFGLPSNEVRSITEDELGHLWIGTAGFGIARMNIYTDSFNLKVFNENDGLSSGNVYLMEFDDAGALWVGCGRGVDRIELDEFQNFKSIKSYGSSDGFLGIETCQNAVLKDADGHLWFGTIDGVSQFLPNNNTLNTVPPKLQITGVALSNIPFERTEYAAWIDRDKRFKEGLILPYHKNRLSFDFRAINLSNPQKVTYEYMLLGEDEGWSARGTQNSITYSSLAPGGYTFKVRSYNEDSYFNDPPIEMSFIILSPIWQRWWFITSLALALGILIWLIFKTRLNQVKRKAKAAQDKLELKNNLLQLEQKALQLQMNPHFIFNALNTVQSLFMSNEQVSGRQLISKFAKLMRSILENSRTPEISLQKEIDLLDNYLAIEQFSRPGKFDYEIEVAPDLDVEEINIPPMMIQPFVENAIIHGVNQLGKKGLIKLNFYKENKSILCKISDNGIGRAAAAKRKAQNARKHKSVALEVIKERLDFLNKENSGKSLIINDLKNIDGDSAGTEVLIRLPMEEW